MIGDNGQNANMLISKLLEENKFQITNSAGGIEYI
jgi:hypothetical protein